MYKIENYIANELSKMSKLSVKEVKEETTVHAIRDKIAILRRSERIKKEIKEYLIAKKIERLKKERNRKLGKII